ncbi:sodium/proline symporter [Haladaptatus cibarius]|uniref:sodium/proline symporter n=1 Tax=Haladaptatus cibarius TaxID=453847 RepID=UPI0006790715|nr:sodium/proline symporter [Haladaptatus cibarius]
MVQAGTNTVMGLVGYLIVVILIGYWGSKKVESEEDFFLGGEKLPGWALALSERSSGMSGWLLLGMPGLAWATGLSSVWVLVGASGGAIIQWVIYSKPFMNGRKETGAITPIGLIAEKLPGDSPMIRLLPALVTFVFYMGYVGSQFLAGGKILQQIFGITPLTGLLIVAVMIIAYSLAGGFLAVVWTDALQALLMVFTLIVLPAILLVSVVSDPSLSVMGSLEAAGEGRASWFGGKTGAAALLLLGANLSWIFADLGGYPHLDVRLMAMPNNEERKTAVIIATFWGILTSIGAVLLGLLTRTLHGAPQAIQADREMVLPFMVLEHTPGLLGGIMLAGALAAMMSTADSQLVVASSAAAQDVYNKVVAKERTFSEKTRLRISRAATLIVGLVGLTIALSVEDLVYTLVSYSATGLFSAFGPAFTLLFFWRDNLSKAGVAAAFLVGPAVTILWTALGFTSIVTVRLVAPPIGFAAAILASLIWPREEVTETPSPETPTVQD